MIKRAIITGATSMLGVALIQSCQKQFVPVVAVIRPGSKKVNRFPTGYALSIVECDIHDYNNLPDLINGTGGVFYHFAWSGTGPERNKSYFEQIGNIGSTISAFHAARKIKATAFIGAGSQAEYGMVDKGLIGPDTHTNPRTPYGLCKYLAGRLVLLLGSRYDMRTIWARVFSVYGIHDKPSSMISQTLQKIINNEPTKLTSGEQLWDYLFSEDAGKAFYLLGEYGKDQTTYCVASGECRPLLNYLRRIESLLKPDIPLGIGQMPYPQNSVRNLCADISNLIEDTGFKPSINFVEGIMKTYSFLRKNQSQ